MERTVVDSLPKWLQRYLRRVKPIKTSLSLFFGVSAVLAVTTFNAGLTTGPNSPASQVFSLMFCIVFPLFAIVRDPAGFAKMWLGLLTQRRLYAYCALAVSIMVAYEALNLKLQFHMTLNQLPMPNRLRDSFAVTFGEPFSEEFFFQVGLQTYLERFGVLFGLTTTAIVFAAIHAASPGEIVSSLVTHFPHFLFIGWLWFRYRSFGLILLVHSGYNAVLELTGTDVS